MSTLDYIIEQWTKDSKIDEYNITEETIKIPLLHQKYFTMYVTEGLKLKKFKTELKKLSKLKFEYYRGDLTLEDLKKYGWEPQPRSIINQHLSLYIDADEDVQELSLKISYQETVVEYIDSILKQLNNRGYQLKTIVDWEKFKAGI